MLMKLASAIAVIVLSQPASADITLDPAGKGALITDAKHTIALHIGLDGRCLVDDLSVLGHHVISPNTGGCTAIKVGDVWYTTRESIPSPHASLDGAALTISDIRYGPPDFPVFETWVFSTSGDDVDWKITRTYHATGVLGDTYFPGFDFSDINTWTGGTLDTGGVAWCRYLDTPVATYASHAGSVTFWNKDLHNCLRLTCVPTPSSCDMTARFSHHPSNVFSASFWPSTTPLKPAHDLARYLHDRQDVWAPTPLVADPEHPLTVTNAITLSALSYDQVSDLGRLNGIDGRAVREIVNTIARYGVIDRGISGSNGWRSSYACTHEPWLAELGLIVTDPHFITNYASTLDDIQRVAISPEGRVLARWHADAGDAMPGTFNPDTGYYEAQWGYLLDSQPSHVMCVAEQFDLTGDLAWLRSHRDSCRAALEYMLGRDSDHDGLLEVVPSSCKEEKASDWIDIVWASHENALVNAEMYEALNRWSALEMLVGDRSHADAYRHAAERMKAAFNKPISDGGLWNPDRNWYVYWRESDNSIHGDNLVTPVNFAAVAYGLCDDPARSRSILDQIETLMQKEGLFHWPLCFFPYRPEEVHASQRIFPSYENGDMFLGWAELAVRAYARSEPAIAMKYIHKVIDRYNTDGLSFQRYLRADGRGAGDDILANNAMAIVGLYRDIYGILPRHDRLFLDPHLTPELVGTRLKYPLRGVPYAIELDADWTTVSAGDVSISAAQAFGVEYREGAVRYFSTIDQEAGMTIAWDGLRSLDIGIESWPSAERAHERAWTLTPSGGPASVSHTVVGLPASTSFNLVRDGKTIASPRSAADGTIEFAVKSVGAPTRLRLEAATQPK